MKYAVLYDAPTDMARVRDLFPAHRASWQAYAQRGALLMIGPFTDRSHGALGIFTTREAAEAFVAQDPFVTSGVVPSWRILEWMEALVPDPS